MIPRRSVLMNYDKVRKQLKIQTHVFISLDMKCNNFSSMLYGAETILLIICVYLPMYFFQDMIEVMTTL